MAITAKKCVPVHSSWVRMFVLTCDGKLAVWFKDGACCYYPASSEALFNLALAWASAGKFVRHFLYKKLAYQLIKPPCPAAGCTVAVACCPAALPQTLHATLANALRCACVSGSIPLTWNAATSKWEGTGNFGTCGHQV